MRKTTMFVVAGATLGLVLWSAVGSGQVPFRGRLVTCLHDEAALQADQSRREQALALGRAINDGQGIVAQRTRRYQALSQVANLPQTPAGFVLQFYTDGEGYVFSLKDDRDPCHYGIFSDQNGRLYEASPQVPQLAS